MSFTPEELREMLEADSEIEEEFENGMAKIDYSDVRRSKSIDDEVEKEKKEMQKVDVIEEMTEEQKKKAMQAIYEKRYRERHKDRVNARQRKRYAENEEVRRKSYEAVKEWRSKNRDRVNACQRDSYKRNKDKILQRQRDKRLKKKLEKEHEVIRVQEN